MRAKIPGAVAVATTSIVPASGKRDRRRRDAGVVALRVVDARRSAPPTARAGAPVRRRARRRRRRSAAAAAAWYQEPPSITSAAMPTSAIEDDGDEDERLPGLVADAGTQRPHSSRSVAFAVRSPEALKPGRPMLYGYLTVSLTGSPVFGAGRAGDPARDLCSTASCETVFWIAVVRGGAGACGPLDRGCPRADARRVGDREVVVEGEAELADAQHEHHEERQDDRELDERLTVLRRAASTKSCVCGVLMFEREFGRGLRRRGRPRPERELLAAYARRSRSSTSLIASPIGVAEAAPTCGEQDADDDDREDERVLDERLTLVLLEILGAGESEPTQTLKRSMK